MIFINHHLPNYLNIMGLKIDDILNFYNLICRKWFQFKQRLPKYYYFVKKNEFYILNTKVSIYYLMHQFFNQIPYY